MLELAKLLFLSVLSGLCLRSACLGVQTFGSSGGRGCLGGRLCVCKIEVKHVHQDCSLSELHSLIRQPSSNLFALVASLCLWPCACLCVCMYTDIYTPLIIYVLPEICFLGGGPTEVECRETKAWHVRWIWPLGESCWFGLTGHITL